MDTNDRQDIRQQQIRRHYANVLAAWLGLELIEDYLDGTFAILRRGRVMMECNLVGTINFLQHYARWYEARQWAARTEVARAA